MLTVVATPIGDPEDISRRAERLLAAADTVVGEEYKQVSKLLRQLGIQGKPLEVLNEHSTPSDRLALVELARSQNVVLVSDCGTPGFCDPGAELVRLCREQKIQVTAAPGASSLMAFLSLAGVRLDQFYFQGFLPAHSADRESCWKQLVRRQEAIVIMDTPYRLKKTLKELKTHFHPSRVVVVGANLTMSSERIWTGSVQKLSVDEFEKAPFVAAVMPQAAPFTHPTQKRQDRGKRR